MTELGLAERLKRIEQLEHELAQSSVGIIGAGTDLFHVDFFIVGALRRTLAQARGFRDLINARNFPCAAAILRLQLDTAMRLNALSLVGDVNATCKAVLDGEQLSRLKDQEGNKLSDAHLRNKLAEIHPWIGPVYEQTSNFVHLSGKHFEVSIARTDDMARTAYFQISGHDPCRSDETYFEAVDTFFEATKLVGGLLLALLMAWHPRIGGGASSCRGGPISRRAERISAFLCPSAETSSSLLEEVWFRLHGAARYSYCLVRS